MLLWAASEKKYAQFFIGLAAAAGTYLATYAVYFFYHPNPLEFLRFELFRFRWWTGDRSQPRLLIFQTLFTGQFKGWWSAFAVEIARGWSLSWPLLFLLQLAAGGFLPKSNKETITLYLYAQSMMILYAVGAASYARYLVPLLPFWAILGLWGAKKIIEAVQKKPLVSNMLHEKPSAQ
jgi:hypothetical protein